MFCKIERLAHDRSDLKTSNMGKLAMKLLFLPFMLLSFEPASAADTWFFDGRCHESYLKSGATTADLTKEAGQSLRCEKAVVNEFKNGRKLINFATDDGVVGFAGPILDRRTNPKMTIMPIDTIYPRRDLGAIEDKTLQEAFENALKVVEPLRGAKGYCFFDTKDFLKVTAISCASEIQLGEKRSVYSVHMTIEKIKTSNLGF